MHESLLAGFRNDKHKAQWKSTLETYAASKPVAVTSRVARAANISASSKWNGLEELERLVWIASRVRHRVPSCSTPQAPKS